MRFDFIFSYWIFAWFLLYVFGIISYNPKLFIIIALLINILEFLLLLFYRTPMKTVIYFTIIIFILKILPLYWLKNTTIQLNDIPASVVLFIIYIVWLYINRTDVIRINTHIMLSLIRGKYTTPMIELLDKLFNHLLYAF